MLECTHGNLLLINWHFCPSLLFFKNSWLVKCVLKDTELLSSYDEEVWFDRNLGTLVISGTFAG